MNALDYIKCFPNIKNVGRNRKVSRETKKRVRDSYAISVLLRDNV